MSLFDHPYLIFVAFWIFVILATFVVKNRPNRPFRPEDTLLWEEFVMQSKILQTVDCGREWRMGTSVVTIGTTTDPNYPWVLTIEKTTATDPGPHPRIIPFKTYDDAVKRAWGIWSLLRDLSSYVEINQFDASKTGQTPTLLPTGEPIHDVSDLREIPDEAIEQIDPYDDPEPSEKREIQAAATIKVKHFTTYERPGREGAVVEIEHNPVYGGFVKIGSEEFTPQSAALVAYAVLEMFEDRFPQPLSRLSYDDIKKTLQAIADESETPF